MNTAKDGLTSASSVDTLNHIISKNKMIAVQQSEQTIFSHAQQTTILMGRTSAG
jgi:hypothetical protein